MKNIFVVLILVAGSVSGQKLKKADKQIVAALQAHIGYLANDKLEGRRMGTAGEKLAYDYIITQFKSVGLLPVGDNQTYLQKFE